jgi:antitoxin ChpS
MFAIPKPILDGLGLAPNTQVGLSVSAGKLIVQPHPRTCYTLAELMELCDPLASPSADGRAWLEAESVGREVL